MKTMWPLWICLRLQKWTKLLQMTWPTTNCQKSNRWPISSPLAAQTLESDHTYKITIQCSWDNRCSNLVATRKWFSLRHRTTCQRVLRVRIILSFRACKLWMRSTVSRATLTTANYKWKNPVQFWVTWRKVGRMVKASSFRMLKVWIPQGVVGPVVFRIRRGLTVIRWLAM